MIYNSVIQINICHAQHQKDSSHTTCQAYLPQTKFDYVDTHSQIAIKRYSTTIDIPISIVHFVKHGSRTLCFSEKK